MAAAALIIIARYLLPLAAPAGNDIVFLVSMMGALIGSLATIIWWVFFSRASWINRLTAVIVMVAALFAVRPLLHESITGGAMGALGYFLTIPVLCVGLVVWAKVSVHSSLLLQRAMLVVAMLLAGGTIISLRTDGISSSGFDLQWRWTASAEDRLLAEVKDEPTPPPAAPPSVAAAPKENIVELAAVRAAPADLPTPPALKKAPEWPGFRGPLRDGIIRGVRIATDWSQSPPVKLWSRPVGPGWSSFAVDGDLLYTQEQRGEDEIVACYSVSTGQPVWRHRDPVRFYESNAGAGPRGTPTLSDGRVYTFGGTGILNALDAANGAVIWSRNVASDSTTEIPIWGFSSSPLVVDDLVIIAAEGKLAAYDIATGKPRWFGSTGGFSYSSPHLVTIAGVQQVLLLAGAGAQSVAPATGTLLWQHDVQGGAIVQPAVTADGDVLVNSIAMTGGAGIRRLAITPGSGGGWSVDERWTSTGLKPYFNDFVVHKGHAYGFDGSILSSIDLADGARKWKGGRYGGGQLVLLPEQDLLLVLSEEGELALVSATPDGFREIARAKAIEGKTWNHPVLARDTLLVRNGEEMAAFRLALAN
jgi:outer membrane protein assembly factor BamB